MFRGDRVDAPMLAVPRGGLVAAAAAIDNPEDRWLAGVRYLPEGCGVSGRLPADCVPGSDAFDAAAVHGQNDPELYFDAFTVWAGDSCTLGVFRSRDFVGRATRAVTAEQSWQIAAELWTGTVTQGRHADPGDRSPYLLDGDATDHGSIAGMAALVRVDSEFARCSRNRRAMIHVTPYALGRLLAAGSDYVYRDGTLLVTQLGSIVVADGGYGSSVTDLRVQATPLVGIRLGPVQVVPDPDRLEQATTFTTNRVTWFAQRQALYQFDADCCRHSATITL